MSTWRSHSHLHRHELERTWPTVSMKEHSHAHEHSESDLARHPSMAASSEPPRHDTHEDEPADPKGRLWVEDLLTGREIDPAKLASKFADLGRAIADPGLARGYLQMAADMTKVAATLKTAGASTPKAPTRPAAKVSTEMLYKAARRARPAVTPDPDREAARYSRLAATVSDRNLANGYRQLAAQRRR